jgi:hypothetical protein
MARSSRQARAGLCVGQTAGGADGHTDARRERSSGKEWWGRIVTLRTDGKTGRGHDERAGPSALGAASVDRARGRVTRFPAPRPSLTTRTRSSDPRQTQGLTAPDAAGDSQSRPSDRRRALLRWSTRAQSPSDGQPCPPCWQSHAAWRDPSTQIHDLPWPRCPSSSPVRSCSRCFQSLNFEPDQCNRSATQHSNMSGNY